MSSSTPSLVDSLFQRTLDDLIRSLRSAPPSSEPTVLSSALSSALRELRSPDPTTKSLALSKLTYLSSLHSLPLDPTVSFFPALEILPCGPHKRVAYLFCSLHFHPSVTDLLPLSTHQLHKDLQSPSDPIAALALNLLSSASSPDLSAHLTPDLLPLLSSTTRPSIRRKSTAALLSVINLSPDSVPAVFPKLVANLSDPVSVAAAVNVFCKLAAKDPRPYLPRAGGVEVDGAAGPGAAVGGEGRGAGGGVEEDERLGRSWRVMVGRVKMVLLFCSMAMGFCELGEMIRGD